MKAWPRAFRGCGLSSATRSVMWGAKRVSRCRGLLPVLAAVAVICLPLPVAAMQNPLDVLTSSQTTTTRLTVFDEIRHALIRLPLAAMLGTVLAVRPKRPGTPPRQPAVIQTQIILAIVGALVMLVVGTNLARAF